jgi:hypothetical protein
MLFGHAVPADRHVLFRQHPPLAHVLSEQQGWPGPPHCAQMPFVHTSFASHARPGQQASPAAPHVWQMPPTHAPDEHWLLAQHVVPRAPQPALPSVVPPSSPPGPVVDVLLLLHATNTKSVTPTSVHAKDRATMFRTSCEASKQMRTPYCGPAHPAEVTRIVVVSVVTSRSSATMWHAPTG